MGFKCRLFGHTYGAPEVERNRSEEGDEVVVTIRNVKRCERCGDERMVNQTKEVTSVRTPEEVGLDTGAEAAPEPAGEAETGTGAGTESDEGESPVTPVADPAAEAEGPADTVAGSEAEPEPAGGAEAGVSPGVTGVSDVSEADDSRDEDAAGEPAAAAEAGAETEAEADHGWETGSDGWDDVDPDPDVDDAVILDPAETERDEVQWPEGSDAEPDGTEAAVDPDPDPGPEASEQADADPEDAEIIDAGEPGGDPAAGAEPEPRTGNGNRNGNRNGNGNGSGAGNGWPDHEDTGAAGGWPDHDGADEGYSATANGDVDAEFVGDGLTPEVNGGAPDDPEAVDGITVGGADGPAAEQSFVGPDAGGDADPGAADDGFVRAGESTAEDVPSDRVEFYCPNCGHARTAGASSIRAGDICPECKQGYIAERER